MKQVHIKSAIPIYIAAAVWLLMGLIAPKFILKLPGLLVTAALSAGIGFAARKLFPDRDVTVLDEIHSGNAEVDREIQKGRERMENLRRANEAIPDPEISRNLDRMYTSGQQIFKELGRDPKKIAMVRRFMSYYLPTAEKLMEQYQVLMGAQTKGENIQSAMERIESGMGLIADAFDKAADNLYRDDEMDIDAEIKVMQTMLTGDNLVQTGVNDLRGFAASRAQSGQAASDEAAQAQPADPQSARQAGGDGEMKQTKDGIRLTLGGK